VNPPLDARTWVVVPFDNLRKLAEIDWLRSASVNLLYLDMSRWRDIRVIDDERVADLLREVPEAANIEKLDLSAGLAVAKRAGAGWLVMGDLLQLGTRTAVTAKVYDVRTGQRLRSVQDATTSPDSVIPMFSRLAQKILNVAPPAGASLGAVGTTSVSAYQEYLNGIQALNGFRIDEARAAFDRALKLDSAFALAHYKQSITYGWVESGSPEIRTHAEAAARLSAALPPRERSLINGHVLQARREWGRSCDVFATLLRADSSDVEAWYGLGDCRFHDTTAEPIPGDTNRVRFKSDLNESIFAFRRLLELEPNNHLAYQHIVDGYLAEMRNVRHCVDTRCTIYQALPLRSGDSIVFTPIAVPRDSIAWRLQVAEYARTASRRRNIASAVLVAEQWVAASPGEARARVAYATALLAAGRITEAATFAEKLPAQTQALTAFNHAIARVEVITKLWRGADAIRAYDSARVSPIRLGNNPPVGSVLSLLAPMFGRMIEFDSVLQGNVRTQPSRPAQGRLLLSYPRVVFGVPHDSDAVIERAAFDEVRATGASAATATRAIGLMLGFGLLRTRIEWPAIDTSVRDQILQPAIALYLRDTSRLRSAAMRLDSSSTRLLAALMPDTAITLVAAIAYLAARDSASALRMTRRMLDSIVPYSPLVVRGGGIYALFVPRAMIMRADLAAALGHADEARVWYKRFLDLWATASPEFQPLVQRVRRSYAAIGGT
jgi:tetratricopeptide (TPR) repeat protein/TolB-like protein